MIEKRESKEQGIIRIFVASPGDVGELRAKVLDAMEKEFRLLRYNDLTGYRIETMGWEEIPSTTGMPQDVINETLLPKADIVLGFIKHKLGTPVKDLASGTIRSRSGTVEEILYALAKTDEDSRPLLMAYFYDKEPTITGLSDPNLDKKREDWKDIQDFKNLLKDQVIFHGYGDDNDKELTRLCTHIRGNIDMHFIPRATHISPEALEALKRKAESHEQLEELKKKYAELEAQLSEQPDKKEALEELEQGKFEKTEESLLATLEKQEKQIETDKIDAAQTYFELAQLKALEFKHEKAEIFYANAVKLSPSNTLYINNYGYLLMSIGQYLASMKLFKKALKIDLESLKKNHPNIAVRHNNIGFNYSKLGNENRALKHFQRALKIDLEYFGEKHPKIAIRYSNIGSVYNALGVLEEALKYFHMALEINLETLGKSHPYVAILHNNIGFAHYKLGDTKEALRNFQLAFAIDFEQLGDKHPNLARDYNNIGGAKESLGDVENALENYVLALNINLQVLGDNHPDTAADFNNIGGAYYKLANIEMALEYFQKALIIFQKRLGNDHPNTRLVAENIKYVKEKANLSE